MSVVTGKKLPEPPPPKEIQLEAVIASDGTVIKPKPYVIGRPEKDKIIEQNFQNVMDIIVHERHQRNKWILFSTCTLCSFAGIMVILYALAITREFSGKNHSPNWKIFAGGCAMFFPFLFWLCFLFCPGRQERRRRNDIRARKRVRRKFEKLREDYFNGDLELDNGPKVDKYGMTTRSGAAPMPGSAGAAALLNNKPSLAEAALAAMKSSENNNRRKSSINNNNRRSATSWSASFIFGEKRKLDAAKGRETLDMAELHEPDPEDQFAPPPPAPGGVRLTEENKYDPAVLSIVMPRKKKARIRDKEVCPEIENYFDTSELVNEYSQASIAKYMTTPGKQKGMGGVPPPSAKEVAALSAAAAAAAAQSNKVTLPPIVKNVPGRERKQGERNSFRQSSMNGEVKTSVKFKV